MGLKSALMRDDPRLEACLVSDPAHVIPGSRGSHVMKIQIALNQLTGARLAVDGIYGPRTAKAVTDYKNDASRRILQPWQTTADDIVGKRTIASLDAELADGEPPPGSTEFQLLPALTPAPPQASAGGGGNLLLAFKIPAFPDLIPDPAALIATQVTRIQPRQVGELRVLQARGLFVITCTNNVGSATDRIALIHDPALNGTDRLVPNPTGPFATSAPLSQGGMVFVTGDPFIFRVDGFQPGDATIIAFRGFKPDRSMRILVRQNRSVVPGTPLTRPTAGSRFFSAGKGENPEPDITGLFSGRPINPRGNVRINFGREGETPSFMDYQVSADFAHFPVHKGDQQDQSFKGPQDLRFRPLSDDPHPEAFVLPKSATHITMRGTQFVDGFQREIRRIAGPQCLFTFSNDDPKQLARVRAFVGKEPIEANGANLAFELN